VVTACANPTSPPPPPLLLGLLRILGEAGLGVDEVVCELVLTPHLAAALHPKPSTPVLGPSMDPLQALLGQQRPHAFGAWGPAQLGAVVAAVTRFLRAVTRPLLPLNDVSLHCRATVTEMQVSAAKAATPPRSPPPKGPDGLCVSRAGDDAVLPLPCGVSRERKPDDQPPGRTRPGCPSGGGNPRA
jgi:hypothetical protein